MGERKKESCGLRQRQFNRTEAKGEISINIKYIIIITCQTSDAQCNCSPPAVQPVTEQQPSATFFPSSLYTEYHHMVWDIPWLSWGQLPWLCPLPASCAAPASRWWDGLGDKKASTPVSAAQQQLNTSV